MGRKKGIAWRWRIAAFLLLVAIIGGVAVWWHLVNWVPPRADWPRQGVLVGEKDVPPGEDAVNFIAFKAIGADFAYLEASDGAAQRDPAFGRNLDEAKLALLPVGAVHRYDPCIAADNQAGNFVTVVPRDANLLPPAIELDRTADDCDDSIRDAEVESELTTFLNQVEGHAGKPSLLMITEQFEERYHLASRIERNLWLARDRFQPGYAGRPWTLWTANSALRSEASDIPVRWVVVQP